MEDKPHFFISRAGEDAEYARWVAEVLEAEGYTTTLQDLDFRPGNSFLHQMSKAHKRAGHVIALLSPHYVAKEFTLNELYSALAKDGLGEARRLIPVRIAPCEIPDVINHIIYVDLVGKDKSAARDLLLDGTRLNSSHLVISYAVFCLKKNN